MTEPSQDDSSLHLDPISHEPIATLAVLRPCGHRFELANVVRSLRGQPTCPVCRVRIKVVDASTGAAAAIAAVPDGAAPTCVEQLVAPVSVRYAGVTYLLHATRHSTPRPTTFLAELFGLAPASIKTVLASTVSSASHSGEKSKKKGGLVSPDALEPGSSVMLVGTRVGEALTDRLPGAEPGEEGWGGSGGNRGAGGGAVGRAAGAVGAAASAVAATLQPALARLWGAWIALVLGVLLFLRSLLPCGTSHPNRRAAGVRLRERRLQPAGYNDERPGQREGRDGGAAAAARAAFPAMADWREEGEEGVGGALRVSRFAMDSADEGEEAGGSEGGEAAE